MRSKLRDEDLTDAELAAEVSGLRDRVAALEGVRRTRRAAARPGPLRALSIHPMPLASRAQRDFHLFYDLFVHSDRRKLTAVAPYYGEDFDLAAHGFDPESVELSVAELQIRGTRIPYALDGWEPSILFDFEHPELAERIAAGPDLEVRVRCGAAARTFRLDTRPPPAHDVSLALCVRDENRWLAYYLDYYLEVLGAGHVYVYDNRTRDTPGLRRLLAPYAAQGQVTLIPWDFAWRNRKDQKQIGQPPQEAHTLARFGADRWIGFFDTDEFLHVPGGDLAGLLAGYDASEIGALGFKMRWAMYKGQRGFEDIHNPLVECVYARETDNWHKRWKLFVSPQCVRFMRFHWIQEDQKTIHLPHIHYYHYCLRDFRFEEGKGDAGLGAETFRDETLRRVWEHHAHAPERSRLNAGAPASRLVAHVEQCFARALRGESKLVPAVLSIEGMIGDHNRHFLNNLCAFDGARLLEIGAWQGASTCASVYGNAVQATVIDDWRGWGNQREACLGNIERFRGRSQVRVLELDCFDVDAASLGRFDVYYYDGDHQEASHYRAVVDFQQCLADEAVLVVDDWNRRSVRDGTRRGLAEIPGELLFAREITVPEAPRPSDGKLLPDPRSWWNGVACFVIRRH